nr:PREDICTED: UHRF1-binding protein 1 isoform X1 [Lepisosteus oculatus]
MAGIIKKQILKHLSRFTKNLSPDKINLSTLKGEGQLSNLELDEEVLQNMLDLPTWLAVTRVFCNKAAIRIQWTKLKTSPICLFLDKVEVEMRTCEEPRPPNGPSPIAITAGQSEYGFAEKVVEGMSVVINSITIKVRAQAFHASFELWQLQGNSLNPRWQRSDLRYTRITDPKRGEVLTFKEINWQSLRIEADAIEGGEQDLGSTPLRLITNQGRIRIALKRRVKDCNVLASKLLFILDDLLWVLTDSQLKALIRYAQSLSEAIEKSAQQRKNLASDGLQTAPPSPGSHLPWAEPAPPPSGAPSTLSQYFELHDVKESSYHTLISRLDLHICNDSSAEDPEEPRSWSSTGAMQLTFRMLGFDYYPFHRPGDGCRHWERHCGAMETRAQWAGKLLQEFQRQAEAGAGPPGSLGGSPMASRESPYKRAPADGASSPPECPRASPAPPSPHRLPWKRLRASCVVVRVDDLDIHQVSTGGRHSKKPQSLMTCNRRSLHLPDTVSAIHFQFMEYYFPDNPQLPVPCSNLYLQLNGLQLCLDPASLVWMNLFAQGLRRSLEQVKAFYKLQDSGKAEEHVDVRMDASQLKLLVPLDSSILDHPDRPQTLCIHVWQAVMTNTRHSTHGTRADLQGVYHSFAACPFFQPSADPGFPRDQASFHPLPPAFLQHALEEDPPPDPLNTEKPPRAQDVWALSLSRLALDFEGARRGPRGRPLPFVEPFAASLWICRPTAFQHQLLSPSHAFPSRTAANTRLRSSVSCDNHIGCSPVPEGPGNKPKSRTVQNLADLSWPAGKTAGASLQQNGEAIRQASVHVLAQTLSPVKLWLNHYQYVALLRMKDTLASLAAELTRDVRQDAGQQAPAPSVSLGLLLESVEAGVLLPPAATEPEEARSPAETDSPSLTDSELSPLKGPPPGGAPPDTGELELPVEEACEAVEEEEESGAGLSPPLSPPARPLRSRDPSSFSLEGELASALTATKDATKEALSASLDLTKEAISITKDAFSVLSREKMSSTMHKMLFTPQSRDQPSRPEDPPGNLRVQSMKHSPSQHSFESSSLDGSLPDDGLSVDSDSSENFVILMDSESGMESMRPDSTPSLLVDQVSRGSPALGTEGGSSADLSSSLSQSTEDISQDTVSVLLLRLRTVGCMVDVQGDDLVVALESRDLVPEQLGNMKVMQLLSGQAPCAPLAHKPPSPEQNATPVARMRIAMGPAAAHHSPLSETVGFLELKLNGCQADLLTSTLATIGPFLEDELSADVQPMRIHLDNTTITLKDDGPRIYPTSPQPVPVIFSIDRVLLERTDDGVFRLRARESETPAQTVARGEQDTETVSGACWEQSDPVDCDSAGQEDKVPEKQSSHLQSRLAQTEAALARASTDRERLLLEIRKYDPLFNL